VKHILLLFYISLTGIIQCHEPLLEQHNYSQPISTYSNPQAITNTQYAHSNNIPSPQRSYNQKNYYANDLSSSQKLSVIQNLMGYLGKKKSSIPYAQISASTPPTTANFPPHSKPHITVATNTAEQPITSIDPCILETKDQLFVQQQCREWDTHAAIINTRIKAIKQIKNNNSSIAIQHHEISQKTHHYCGAHKIDTDILTQCSGTILQHTIHQEFVTITKKSSKIWHHHRLFKPLHKMTNTIAGHRI
jgi:hypothetical protein